MPKTPEELRLAFAKRGSAESGKYGEKCIAKTESDTDVVVDAKFATTHNGKALRCQTGK